MFICRSLRCCHNLNFQIYPKILSSANIPKKILLVAKFAKIYQKSIKILNLVTLRARRAWLLATTQTPSPPPLPRSAAHFVRRTRDHDPKMSKHIGRQSKEIVYNVYTFFKDRKTDHSSHEYLNDVVEQFAGTRCRT